jgi:hypothetical protein
MRAPTPLRERLEDIPGLVRAVPEYSVAHGPALVVRTQDGVSDGVGGFANLTIAAATGF